MAKSENISIIKIAKLFPITENEGNYDTVGEFLSWLVNEDESLY
jgi:hypothetical protein